MDYKSFQPGGQKTVIPPVAQMPSKTFTPKFIGLIVLLLVVGGSAYAGLWFWNDKNKEAVVPTFTPRVIDETAGWETYRNEQYGFSITLTYSWKGYTILNSQWEGRDVASGNVIEHGPVITLHHPQWTAANPREDMPVMIFTPAQWNLVMEEKISVGAAPIPPSVLGQNSKYIIALPARYNYDYKTGWEEVDELAHTLKAYEPKEGQICIQVITHAKNTQTGEEKDFPTPCDVPEGWEPVNS